MLRGSLRRKWDLGCSDKTCEVPAAYHAAKLWFFQAEPLLYIQPNTLIQWDVYEAIVRCFKDCFETNMRTSWESRLSRDQKHNVIGCVSVAGVRQKMVDSAKQRKHSLRVPRHLVSMQCVNFVQFYVARAALLASETPAHNMREAACTFVKQILFFTCAARFCGHGGLICVCGKCHFYRALYRVSCQLAEVTMYANEWGKEWRRM